MSQSGDNSCAQEESVLELTSEQIEAIVDFAKSEVFSRLFKTGMAMIEETASYLDGPGRDESKRLPRKIGIAYAGESMRLTTRLMQVASWLLVHRAIEEGELSAHEARDEKYRLGAREICRGNPLDSLELLPERLQDLLSRSEQLYDRVSRLDETLYVSERKRTSFDVQLDRLHEAFGDGLPQPDGPR